MPLLSLFFSAFFPCHVPTLLSFQILPLLPALQWPLWSCHSPSSDLPRPPAHLFPLPHQPSGIYTGPLAFILCQIMYCASALAVQPFSLPACLLDTCSLARSPIGYLCLISPARLVLALACFWPRVNLNFLFYRTGLRVVLLSSNLLLLSLYRVKETTTWIMYVSKGKTHSWK